MRYKVAPPAGSLQTLAAAQQSLPLVPDGEADCCEAIQAAIDVGDRAVAREYLGLLVALELAAETDRGYHRTRTDPSDAPLGTRYEQRVFGVAELLDALDAGPLTAAEAFDALRDIVPTWERNRQADWRAAWERKTTNLLDWAVVFGLARTVPDGYEPTRA